MTLPAGLLDNIAAAFSGGGPAWGAILARTGMPARAMLRAIGSPMVPPAPSTATVSLSWSVSL